MPRSEDDAKKGVGVTAAAFHRAILAADTKALESLTDESFIWTRPDGGIIGLTRLLDILRSGLRYSKLEPIDVTVSIYGDAAVVRGMVLLRPASTSVKNPGGATEAAEHYTMTLVNRDGAWRVVSMHSSGVLVSNLR